MQAIGHRTPSFDVTTGVDLQEVDNAINQAQKEIAQRYDFKGSKATIEFKRAEEMLVLVADSEFQMRALFDVVQAKLIKRGVSVKNLDIGEIKQAGGDTVRREIKLKTALDSRHREEGRRGDQGREAEEGAGGHPGRSGARDVAVEGRAAGGHRAAAEKGLRRRAEVRQLSLNRRRTEAAQFAAATSRSVGDVSVDRCERERVRRGSTIAMPRSPRGRAAHRESGPQRSSSVCAASQRWTLLVRATCAAPIRCRERRDCTADGTAPPESVARWPDVERRRRASAVVPGVRRASEVRSRDDARRDPRH